MALLKGFSAMCVGLVQAFLGWLYRVATFVVALLLVVLLVTQQPIAVAVAFNGNIHVLRFIAAVFGLGFIDQLLNWYLIFLQNTRTLADALAQMSGSMGSIFSPQVGAAAGGFVQATTLYSGVAIRAIGPEGWLLFFEVLAAVRLSLRALRRLGRWIVLGPSKKGA